MGYLISSGIHADCPNDQYCWSATTCNVHDFWPPPTPRPTNIPTIENLPSESPSRTPSIEPTGLPTLSPLAEDDPANFMYCGVDYVSISNLCKNALCLLHCVSKSQLWDLSLRTMPRLVAESNVLNKFGKKNDRNLIIRYLSLTHCAISRNISC